MAKVTKPVRVGIALVVLFVSGPVWFILALYSGIELLGSRSHPIVDLFAWLVLATGLAAALMLCVELIEAFLRWSNRRN